MANGEPKRETAGRSRSPRRTARPPQPPDAGTRPPADTGAGAGGPRRGGIRALPSALILAALLLALPFSPSAAGDEPFTFPSNLGITGLMETPTARVLRENRYRLGVTVVDPYRIYYGAIGIFPRIELGGRITEVRGVPGFRDSPAYGDYKDKAFDLKLQLLTEGKYRPALALVVLDPHGTRIYAGQAVVASKQIFPFDFTVGLGNGRFGDRPLPRSGDGFRFEMLTHPKSWWEDVRAFGGIQFAPTERFALMAEYSPILYHRQTTDPAQARHFTERVPSPYNFGLRWKPLRWLAVDASWQRGEEIGVSASLAFDIGNPLLPIHDPAWRERPEFREHPLTERLVRGLAASGFSGIRVDMEGGVLRIAAQNDRWFFTPRAVAAALDVLAPMLPEEVRRVRIAVTENGIPVAAFEAAADDVRAFYAGEVSRDRFLERARLTAETGETPGGPIHRRRWLAYGVRPSFEAFLNDPSGFFKYRLGAEGWLALQPLAGTSLVVGAEGYPLNTVSTANEPLSIPVRSDVVLYKEKGAALSRLMADQVVKVGDRLYGRIAAGLLEVMYGGVDAEAALPVLDGRVFLGAGGSYVRKREPDRPFGLIGDREFHTAFLNVRLNVPEIDVFLDVKAGRFLAGDEGARFTLSKFVNGVVLSAWYSATDTSRFTDPFNRGYHDKGIAVEIPIRLFLGKDSRSAYRFALSPWTRDVAQDIERHRTLFDFIGRNTGVYLDRDRDRMYRQAR
jgi:hypothetical protein